MFQINVREVGDVQVVDVAGRLTLEGNGAAKFRNSMRQLASKRSCINLKVVINLLEAEYMDSTGIGTFVSETQMVLTNGGQVKVGGLVGKIRKIFLMSKLMDCYEVHRTAEEAVKAFA